MSALYPVQVALYDRLMADVTFASMVTGGVWNGQAPIGTVGQYVVLSPAGEDDARYFGQPGHSTIVTADCWDVPTDGLPITHYLGVSSLYAALKMALAPEAAGVSGIPVAGMHDDVMCRVRMVTALLDDSVAATAAHIVAEITVTSTVAA